MELEIKDFIRIIKKRVWLIMGLVILATLITGGISHYYIKPVYEASVKLIVTKTDALTLDNGSIEANVKLIHTYKEIIKTPAIMDQVVSKYPELQLNAGELIANVDVSSTNDSQVMTISAQDHSFDRAVRIVNATAVVFQNQIPLIMKIDNVTILNEASSGFKPSPVLPNTKVNMIIGFVLSFMILLGMVIMLEYLDDTLKTEQDINQYLNIPTLGLISKVKIMPNNPIIKKLDLK